MSDEPKSYPRRDFLAQVAAVPALAAVAAQWQPNQALAQTVAVADSLVIAPLSEAELVREVEALMRFVDPAIAYRHTPIAPERNAWPFWKQAMDAYVKEPEHFDDEDSISDFEDGGPPPRPELLKELRDWVRQNGPAMRLMDEGIARGAFELPRATRSIDLSYEVNEELEFRNLVLLRHLSCRLFLLEGKLDAAFTDAESMVRMAEMLLDAECLLIDHLMARIMLGYGITCVYLSGTHANASVHDARRALQLLNVNPSEVHFRNTCRVEFCRELLPYLATIPQSTDSVALATAIMSRTWGEGYSPTDADLAETNRAIQATSRILEGHPHPFDREATVRLANEMHREWFAEMKKPFQTRSDSCFLELFKELEAWPMFATVNVMARVGGMPFEPGMQPTDAEASNARAALQEVDNVVGKYKLKSHFGIAWRDTLEVCHVRLRSLQLQIALTHFERQHGELPATLESLVGDGWFAAVPADPYDGKSFRYSREHRLIWSVGRDGDNDPFGKDRLESDDAFEGNMKGIWKIRPVPAA